MSDFQYKFIKHLGSGSYGSVDLVEYKGQEIALKAQKVKDEKELEMCNNEIDVLKKLHNRYVIHYLDSFYLKSKKNMYILMEYCPNKSLSDLLEYFSDHHKYLSNNGVIKYFCEMVIGLQYLHNHNILHRDLKPDNIFISKDNVCVLADFGLAKEVGSINALNSTIAGTPLYMAPEVLNNEKYNAKAEIWSLGCILHELCTLHPLYQEARSQSALMNLQRTDYDKLKLQHPLPQHIDRKIRDIIKWCLNIDKDKRPTMNDLYNHPIVQKFINETGRSLLFEYDTQQDNTEFDKSQRLIELLNELNESVNIIEEKSELIIEIFDDYKNENTIDKEDECNIFRLIQLLSAYIGRTLLIKPHSQNPKFQYFCIDTYDRMNKNLKKDFFINIINSIISFLSRHSFEDEANAIYEGLKKERAINDDIRRNWEILLSSK